MQKRAAVVIWYFRTNFKLLVRGAKGSSLPQTNINNWYLHLEKEKEFAKVNEVVVHWTPNSDTEKVWENRVSDAVLQSYIHFS